MYRGGCISRLTLAAECAWARAAAGASLGNSRVVKSARVRPAVPVALGALILVGLFTSLLIGGLRDELVILGLLGPAAVGVQIGWSTRASVPTWLFIALAVGGIGLVLAGFSQYNDDGDSGPLFVPLVALGAAALPATALVAGIAAGASWRRARD